MTNYVQGLEEQLEAMQKKLARAENKCEFYKSHVNKKYKILIRLNDGTLFEAIQPMTPPLPTDSEYKIIFDTLNRHRNKVPTVDSIVIDCMYGDIHKWAFHLDQVHSTHDPSYFSLSFVGHTKRTVDVTTSEKFSSFQEFLTKLENYLKLKGHM